jgi:hypothetical protein
VTESVLDDVARGDAFDWPLSDVSGLDDPN